MKTQLKTRRFVILTSQRSGSNFLEQTLNSHPNVRCYGEILLGFDGPEGRQEVPAFLERRPRPAVAASALLSGGLLFPRSTIQRAYGEARESVVGFRLMYNHASGRVLRSLEQDDVSVVHLTRRNVLRQVISRLQMHEAHVAAGTYQTHFARGEQRVSRRGVTLAAQSEEICQGVEELVARRDEAMRWLDGGIRHVSLTYEDFLRDGELNPESLQEIRGFLSIDGEFEASRLTRTGSSTLDNIVEDPAGLRELLDKSGRGWMVDDW